MPTSNTSNASVSKAATKAKAPFGDKAVPRGLSITTEESPAVLPTTTGSLQHGGWASTLSQMPSPSSSAFVASSGHESTLPQMSSESASFIASPTQQSMMSQTLSPSASFMVSPGQESTLSQMPSESASFTASRGQESTLSQMPSES